MPQMTTEFSRMKNHSWNMGLGLNPGLCWCRAVETKSRIPDMTTTFVLKPLASAVQFCERVILDISEKGEIYKRLVGLKRQVLVMGNWLWQGKNEMVISLLSHRNSEGNSGILFSIRRFKKSPNLSLPWIWWWRPPWCQMTQNLSSSSLKMCFSHWDEIQYVQLGNVSFGDCGNGYVTDNNYVEQYFLKTLWVKSVKYQISLWNAASFTF